MISDMKMTQWNQTELTIKLLAKQIDTLLYEIDNEYRVFGPHIDEDTNMHRAQYIQYLEHMHYSTKHIPNNPTNETIREKRNKIESLESLRDSMIESQTNN